MNRGYDIAEDAEWSGGRGSFFETFRVFPLSSAPFRVARSRGQGVARGQALVEFALVTPMFLALMCVLIEVALIDSATTGCQQAATAAAQMVAVAGSSTSTIDQRAATLAATYSHSFVTLHVTGVEIAQVNSQGHILRENRFDGAGQPVGVPGWPVAGRTSTTQAPLHVMVRVSFAYQWMTSFLGISGTSLALQTSATATAPPMGG